MSRLSVLIPVYNERETIGRLIDRVKAAPVGIEREILIGDDGSTDGTRELLERRLVDPELTIEFLERNVGRGGVIKHLWTKCTGEIIVHQDADLEYDPNELAILLEPILSGHADVVFGSRFKGRREKMPWLNTVANHMLTTMCRLLYGIDITDLMTCYKMYRARLIRDLVIEADGFDFEAELTARLAQRRARFAEVPISFSGRTFKEGKKIRTSDAVRVTRTLVWSQVDRGGRRE